MPFPQATVQEIVDAVSTHATLSTLYGEQYWAMAIDRISIMQHASNTIAYLVQPVGTMWALFCKWSISSVPVHITGAICCFKPKKTSVTPCKQDSQGAVQHEEHRLVCT